MTLKEKIMRLAHDLEKARYNLVKGGRKVPESMVRQLSILYDGINGSGQHDLVNAWVLYKEDILADYPEGHVDKEKEMETIQREKADM